MPNTSPCRLLVDPPGDGAWNMAVDEALLALAAEGGLPTLRLYQWQRPTLSLGYFQKYVDRRQHTASRDADVVRRLSGGGAIVHDRELTYSLVLPEAHRLAADTQRLYDVVHDVILQLLRRQLKAPLSAIDAPCEATLCQTTQPAESKRDPFLCFQRRTRGDILMRSTLVPNVAHKIVGSAQRRRRGVVLQHGSLLLGQSTVAPELPGCAELTQHRWQVDSIASELSQAMLRKLDFQVRETEMPPAATASAEEFMRQKYRQSRWTERR